jgi:hypothetical protein
LPWRTIDERVAAQLKGKLVVVYCWSPGCNGSTKGAARLASLGVQVKEMIGGLEYWLREGHDTEGTVPRASRSRWSEASTRLNPEHLHDPQATLPGSLALRSCRRSGPAFARPDTVIP